MFLYQNGSLQHTQQLFKKSKKKGKSEKMISFPARPIFAFLFYEK